MLLIRVRTTHGRVGLHLDPGPVKDEDHPRLGRSGKKEVQVSTRFVREMGRIEKETILCSAKSERERRREFIQ